MFIAYVNDIETGFKVDGIRFTAKKKELVNHICFFEEIPNKPGWYNLFGSKQNRFHESWLRGITPFEDGGNVYVMEFTHRSSGVSDYRIIKTNTRPFKDVEFGELHNSTEWTYNNIANYVRHIIEMDVATKNRLVRCKRCGKNVPEFTSYGHEDGCYCKKCFDSLRVCCDGCGNSFIANDETTFTLGGRTKYYCPDCVSKARWCTECGEFIIRPYQVEGDVFCEKCFNKKTRSDLVVSCSRCGGYFWKNSKEIFEYNSRITCGICHIDNKLKNLRIHNYSHKPSPIFYGDCNKDPLYFGVELEIITPSQRDQIAQYINFLVNDPTDFVYCKLDRSITGDSMGGFEIVSHPFNYSWLKSPEGNTKIEQIMNLKKFGANAFHNNTCGMHVHMNKDAFTHAQLFKFLRLVYGNKDFILLVSDRVDMAKVEKYARFIKDDDQIRVEVDGLLQNVSGKSALTRMAKTMRGLNDVNWDRDTGRHVALNLHPANTIELRVFRSTLKKERFLKNIEFCKSLFEFTSECSLKDATIGAFKDYIKNHRKTYKNFYNFLVNKKEID